AREHLEENSGQCEDIGSLVDRTSPCLLRGHVLKFSLESPGLCVGSLRGCFGDAEVAELDVAFLRDENVLWRNIAMNETRLPSFEVMFPMCVVERCTNFRSNKQS